MSFARHRVVAPSSNDVAGVTQITQLQVSGEA